MQLLQFPLSSDIMHTERPIAGKIPGTEQEDANMRHHKRIIIAAVLLLWLMLCLPAAADILDDSYMTGYLSGAPNYTLMPETEYVVGSMSAAQSTLSSFISQCKSDASGKLEEYIAGIRQHNIEVNGPDCKLEVTYGKPEIHVDVPQFGISGEPADDVTFTGRQLTTGGVTTTYDIHVSATVSYDLKNWSGGPFSDGNTWIPQDFVFFQEKTIARITIYAADRYADVVVSWDYPGETRDRRRVRDPRSPDAGPADRDRRQ